MTLTLELIRDIVIVNPSTKFEFVRQTVKPWESWLTDTHTDRRDQFYTLDRWRGREQMQIGVEIFLYYYLE